MKRVLLPAVLAAPLAPLALLAGPTEPVATPDLEVPLCDDRLLGDFFGLRRPEDTGIDFRIEATNFYHGLLDGDAGILSNDDGDDVSFAGKLDLFVDVDGQKAGLWPGLFVNVHGEFRYGENSRQAAVLGPVNTALLAPTTNGEAFAFTNVTVTQALSESFLITIGKINTIDGATKNFYGGGGREGFMNANFVAAPIGGRTVPISTLGVMATYLKDGRPFINVGVIDAISRETTPGWEELRSDELTFLADITFQSNFGGLPGFHTFNVAYSNIEAASLNQTDLARPPGLGGEVSISSNSWSVGYLGEQFLTQDPNDPTRGWGVFLYAGYSDGDPNPIEINLAGGLMAKGVCAARPCDTFGIGAFWNKMSDDLKDTFSDNLIQALNVDIQDDWGGEIFYDFAITPAFRVGANFQVAEPVIGDKDTAIFGGFRSRVIF